MHGTFELNITGAHLYVGESIKKMFVTGEQPVTYRSNISHQITVVVIAFVLTHLCS